MNILVTGASQGIGFEIALELAKNKEYKIYALARNSEKLYRLVAEAEKRYGFSVIQPVCFDLNEIVKGNFPEVITKETEFGVVIHAAGVLINTPFEQLTLQEIEHQFTVNFIAPTLLTRYLIPHLKQCHKSHVVFIGSMGGFSGSAKFPGLSMYSASKAALGNLAESLAAEYYNSGIAFNCLALGAVDTQMLQTAFPNYKTEMQAADIAKFIVEFALTGHCFFNGKILPMAKTTP